jgi:putative ABC transport system permease protein
MDTLLRDATFALRGLRKNLGFSTVAIVTIALGIGACTAIFSVVNAVLLRPLPYAQPQRLAVVWSELRARNVPDFPFPIPDVRDLRQDAQTFDAFAGVTAPGRVAVGGDGGDPEQARVVGVTTNLFAVLGAPIAMGRDFIDEDGAPPTPPPDPNAAAGPPRLPTIAILSDGFFKRRYGSDRSVVGKTIEFGNGRAQIVGVLRPDFELLFPPRTGIVPNADVFTALRLNFDTAARNTGVLRVIGRMRPGVSVSQAQADLEGIATALRDQYPPKKNANLHIRVVPMHDDLVSEVRPSILALMGAVCFVLLIACANVANLLIVRASARQRELVIRAAIGGSRGRLIRQMLTESLILAALGAAVGLLLADAGLQALISMAPARVPRLDHIRIDPIVLAFTASAALATAIVCGIVPALRASQPDIIDTLKSSGRSPQLLGGRRLRYVVVVVEVALSFALLVGSGLMLRSFVALQRVDPGFDPSHVLTFILPARAQQPEARAAFITQVTARLRALPGVIGVAAAGPLPLDGGTANIPWATEEIGSVDPTAFRQANFFFVLPGYFETMKTRLVAGRTFTEDDNTPDHAFKVVIDDMLASRAYPNASPVGRTLLVRNLRGGANAPFNDKVEIIGVVAHQRHESLAVPGREGIYLPDAYLGFGNAGRWAVRTAGDPAALAPAVRAAAAEIDPKLPLSEVQPMEAFVDRSMAPVKFTMTLIGIFAGIAVALALIGLYGVLSTIVRQRTGEIGMRLVFGAPQASILRLIVGEGMKMTIVGILAGILAALAIARLTASLFVDVSPGDPLTFAAIVVLFTVVALLAAWIPAFRASRLSPMVALRED